ncbi:hypothetical protein [Maribellus maritimus]|uniref:hypothetical protein n=1 Tax=Maribellus maritimus TaxID=2870838 RepID=UPI001EEB46A4|nr:hypothetical protein [Maribellus maritimus]MCG6188290.1 hypothetical protein [Maribellus maritimus]
MNRKEFLKKTALAGSAIGFLSSSGFSSRTGRSSEKKLNAYYFRAHMYTLVPRHVREDLKWMADVGTNIVSVAVLEQDFFAAVENIEIICNEASKLGMDVWAVPSRWGGLVAGAPKVPSLFTTLNQDTWKKNRDGSYASSSVSGRISSIFHPATAEFMQESGKKLFKTWDFKGLIWDEPKSLTRDYHELAVKKLGVNASLEQYIDENVEFYSNINKHIKADFPNKQIAMFIYANKDNMTVNKCATISDMDAYGCDGRPWSPEDGGKQESEGKVLLGGVGQRFIDAARENNKKSLWLIENHNMADADIPILEKRMREVVQSNADHLIYYYYPRNLSQPDKIMDIIKQNLMRY